jgi:phage-related protein
VAKFEEAIHVLHVCQKRSQKTAQADLDLGRSRFADVLKWRREEGL